MTFEIDIPAPNVEDLVTQGYTTIEVWASNDEGGTYQELTGLDSEAPALTSLKANGFQVAGRTLKVRVDGLDEITVDFDTNLLVATPAQVAELINDQQAGLAAAVNGTVVLTGPTDGRVGMLEVTFCDARDLFPESVSARGIDSRIALDEEIYLYSYRDIAGTDDTRYKWRFSADGAVPISPFSERIFGGPGRLTGLQFSVGKARFMDVEGRPIRQRVLIASLMGDVVEGAIFGSDIAKAFEADENGYVLLRLVQGARIRVAFEGTDIVKDVTVPMTPTFDLLQAVGAAPDQFTVQTTEPLLTRRSLPSE